MKISTIKQKKQLRYNVILNHLREPKTARQLAYAMDRPNSDFSDALASLLGEYVVIVGTESINNKIKKSRIYQAIKFEYVEPVDGAVDAISSDNIVRQVYGMNNPSLKEKYIAQAKQISGERKNAQRNYPSGSLLSVAV